MPSFDKFPIFVTDDRTYNRPRSVFDRRSLALQNFRTFDYEDVAGSEGDEDIEELKALAAEAKSELEAKLELKVAEAQRRGQERGFQEAAQVDADERAKLVEKMRGAYSALNTALDKAEAACTEDALRLGLRVAQRISRVVLSENLEAIVANIQSNLEKMDTGDELKIVANPELAKKLSDSTEEVTAQLGIEGWTIEADETLQPGDMVLYRGSCSLDSRVSTRLQIIEEALMKELGISIGPEEEC